MNTSDGLPPSPRSFATDPVSVLGVHAALIAAATTGLLPLVCQDAPTAAECAGKLGLNLRATEFVLEVLAASGLIEREGDCYRKAPSSYPVSMMALSEPDPVPDLRVLSPA